MKYRASNRRHVAALVTLLSIGGPLAYTSADQGPHELSLNQAIEQALERSPELRATKHRVSAAVAQAKQARLWANPEIEGELENIAGSGEFSGTDAAEVTVLVSQSFRLGGKRSGATRMADLDRRLADQMHELSRREVLWSVSRSFFTVLERQERAVLAKELQALSRELVETTARRVKSGGASVLEETKASIEQAASEASRKQADQQLQAARRKLATLLGIELSELGKVSGDLYEVAPLSSYENLREQLKYHPDWTRWAVEMERRGAAVDLADAERVPDLTLGVGWRHIEDANEGAGAESFIVAAGLPLPLFDRNQGARAAARHEQAAAEEDRLAATRVLERELAEVHSELASAHTQILATKHDLLPAARKSFEVSREGYLQGRFGYIDLLDAQRTLFEMRATYVEALLAYHLAQADVARLTGDLPQLETQE